MANFDIMNGANISVELGTHTGGTTVATDFVEIPEVNTFTVSGFESTIVTVKTFNSAFDRKLLGTKNTPDISLAVNYIPGDEVQSKLEALAASQTRCQIKLSYFDSADKDHGFYNTYVCFVSQSALSGDKDAVIAKTFTLAVDGDVIDAGIIEPDTSAGS